MGLYKPQMSLERLLSRKPSSHHTSIMYWNMWVKLNHLNWYLIWFSSISRIDFSNPKMCLLCIKPQERYCSSKTYPSTNPIYVLGHEFKAMYLIWSSTISSIDFSSYLVFVTASNLKWEIAMQKFILKQSHGCIRSCVLTHFTFFDPPLCPRLIFSQLKLYFSITIPYHECERSWNNSGEPAIHKTVLSFNPLYQLRHKPKVILPYFTSFYAQDWFSSTQSEHINELQEPQTMRENLLYTKNFYPTPVMYWGICKELNLCLKACIHGFFTLYDLWLCPGLNFLFQAVMLYDNAMSWVFGSLTLQWKILFLLNSLFSLYVWSW